MTVRPYAGISLKPAPANISPIAWHSAVLVHVVADSAGARRTLHCITLGYGQSYNRRDDYHHEGVAQQVIAPFDLPDLDAGRALLDGDPLYKSGVYKDVLYHR